MSAQDSRLTEGATALTCRARRTSAVEMNEVDSSPHVVTRTYARMQHMAAFLLDAFVVLEVLIMAASLIWISRMAESSLARVALPLISSALVVLTILGLPKIKDDSGLYFIRLLPLSLIILLPAATLAAAGAVWFWSRKKIQRLEEAAGRRQGLGSGVRPPK